MANYAPNAAGALAASADEIRALHARIAALEAELAKEREKKIAAESERDALDVSYKYDFIYGLPGYVLRHPIPVKIGSDGVVLWEGSGCVTSYYDEENPLELLIEIIQHRYESFTEEEDKLIPWLAAELFLMRAFISRPQEPPNGK